MNKELPIITAEVQDIKKDLIDFIILNFAKLSQSITNVERKDYLGKRKILSGASIGNHIRHILELFIELEKGYATGIVQYEARARDKNLETDPILAISIIENITTGILKPNKQLQLSLCTYPISNITSYLPTNYWRELAYNLEHMIHHMAIIKIGLSEIPDFPIPTDYGVAFATLEFKKTCVQ